MKRALVLLAATGALLLHVGTATAQENAANKTPRDPGGRMGASASPDKDNPAGTDGRPAGSSGSDSMSRAQAARPATETLSLAAGGDGLFDAKALPKDGVRPRAQSPELGGSVPLSKTVSLKAAGRYDGLGSVADKGLEGLGGNLGLKISF